MKNEKDILQTNLEELRKSPCAAPEGYFDDFCVRPRKAGAIQRFSPYVALAATFLLVVVLGTAVLRNTMQPAQSAEALNQYDACVELDLIPHTADVDLLCYSMGLDDDTLSQVSLEDSMAE